MASFGPGVGGGLLAAAGALGGIGQGIAQVGEQQSKANLAEKMDKLAQAREEAIERLRGSQQSALEEARAGHEDERVAKEIAGRSNVAQFEAQQKAAEAEKQRGFLGSENAAHRASQEKIAAGHDAARVAAAKAHTPAGSKNPPKEWEDKTVTVGGTIDPVTHAIVGGRSMIVKNHVPTGNAYVPVGDKLIPYDGSKPDGLAMPPEAVRRAPAREVSTLLQNPLGFTPSGMSARDSFLKRNNYLPTAYLDAANRARAQSANGGGGGEPESEAAPQGAEPPEPPDPAETEPDMPNTQ